MMQTKMCMEESYQVKAIRQDPNRKVPSQEPQTADKTAAREDQAMDHYRNATSGGAIGHMTPKEQNPFAKKR